MSDHREIDELSAYLDGELDEADRARVEQHLAGCVECPAVLEDLRRARAALRGLPEPHMTADQAAALDAVVEAARSKSPARSRLRLVAGAAVAAAAVAAAVAIVPRLHSTLPSRSAAPQALSPVSGAYDAASARAALLAFASSRSHPAYAQNAPAAGPAVVGGVSSPATTADSLAKRQLSPTTNCEATIRSTGSDVTLDHTEQGTFVDAQGHPSSALLLFYLAPASRPTRAELWVVRPSDCSILFFSQAPLS